MSRFAEFAALHVPGRPLLLYNAWDAGSARAVADAGAPAVATGSWSVAAANGYADGEAVPMDVAITNAERIIGAVDVPVSIDLEAGYATEPAGVKNNVARLAATGAVGCNLEDQAIGHGARYPIDAAAARVAAARAGAGDAFFLNARTDSFLQTAADAHDAAMADEAIARANAYAAAGASGFFVPGLVDLDLVRRVCAASPLPVNVMTSPGAPCHAAFAAAGVARISYGPGPYRAAMAAVREAARALYEG